MTGADRERVRAAIDAHQRARRQALMDAGELDVCTGCGGDLDCTTQGCKRCWDRKLKHKNRSDPAYLERERERQQRTNAQRAARQKARRRVSRDSGATINA